jgi:hypothetical protein
MPNPSWARYALPLLLCGAAATGRAGDPCAGFSWDVQRERALFAAAPHAATAGKTLAQAPALAPGELYQLELSPDSQVSFAAPPGGHGRAEPAYAGLARLRLATGGVYRISVDQPVWVDVLANGAPIPSRDFQGRPGCSAPHKIVEFALPASTALTLQLSRSAAPSVKLAITHSPAAAQP